MGWPSQSDIDIDGGLLSSPITPHKPRILHVPVMTPEKKIVHLPLMTSDRRPVQVSEMPYGMKAEPGGNYLPRLMHTTPSKGSPVKQLPFSPSQVRLVIRPYQVRPYGDILLLFSLSLKRVNEA